MKMKSQLDINENLNLIKIPVINHEKCPKNTFNGPKKSDAIFGVVNFQSDAIFDGFYLVKSWSFGN